jgi:hypothetical protein
MAAHAQGAAFRYPYCRSGDRSRHVICVQFSERYFAARPVMFNTLETDVATSIAILDRLPAAERAAWLDQLARGSYRFVLGPGIPGNPVLEPNHAEVASKIQAAIGAKYPIEVESIP